MAAMLIDTNVLVYAYDRAEPEKQRRALEVLDALARSGEGRLSAQVLSEFFVNVTRRIPAPLTIAQAQDRLQHYTRIWPVVPLTSDLVFEAIRGVQQYQLSFWDAQIWAAARLGQVSTVLSEDFSPGAVIEGVRFVDPFAGDSRMQEWWTGE
jgi:predicted nucleic acid-binding protein